MFVWKTNTWKLRNVTLWLSPLHRDGGLDEVIFSPPMGEAMKGLEINELFSASGSCRSSTTDLRSHIAVSRFMGSDALELTTIHVPRP